VSAAPGSPPPPRLACCPGVDRQKGTINVCPLLVAAARYPRPSHPLALPAGSGTLLTGDHARQLAYPLSTSSLPNSSQSTLFCPRSIRKHVRSFVLGHWSTLEHSINRKRDLSSFVVRENLLFVRTWHTRNILADVAHTHTDGSHVGLVSNWGWRQTVCLSLLRVRGRV
jgi:hypothetical protein